ncbi:hypothetical protein HMP0721_2074 [Pseudoramibacter alactolyticus ATCC 23263]|uniref:Transposase InsH N-terminal domain-containing protein n=1 Tax=Pseudoramibacter alactolyticus ATCC 23263 TaxID=887929 RepID=E6MJ89_9FIRM|nr:hypothetical protein HMP0721_2074 [Pseudoramibacter alactolyticus ATCC 23263]
MLGNGLRLQTKSTVKAVDFFVVAHVDKAINWPFTYGLVQDKYSDSMGRPSIDPAALIKVPFIQYLDGIKPASDNQSVEGQHGLQFLDLDLYDAVPHFSTLGKNYTRRFQGTDLLMKAKREVRMA